MAPCRGLIIVTFCVMNDTYSSTKHGHYLERASASEEGLVKG